MGARPTLLDVAKDSVEKFLKIRQRDAASRQDRYMLLTFDEYPSNIKAGWKENHNVFMNELKNLTASGMTLLGPAIKNCFDLLNLNRMQTGIDTYGQGRSPFFLESSIIIAITDGGKLTSGVGVQEELNLPMNCNVPGAELTKEPFRWDQRLYALVLRLTGTPPTDHLSNGPPGMVPSDNSPIDAMCEVTGGRSYSISSQRSLMQCLESVVQKIQGGVVIQFEKFGPDPPPISQEEDNSDETTQELPKHGQGVPNGFVVNYKNSNNNNQILNASNSSQSGKSPWHSTRKLIYVHRSAQRGYSTGFWPIPESFWPDLNAPSLPPRSCHPVIKFTCSSSDPMVIDNLPFDKYELETSPLTQYILSRKQPHVAWQCFVANSHKSSDHPLGYPFGYLKASTNLSCVNLFVLPYNYPVLLPLLDELFKIHHLKPTREWKAQFDAYLKNIPLYYAGPLKRALQKMGGPNLVPDNMENCLSYSVLNLLKRLKNQAKVEFDKLIATVGTGKPATPTTIKVPNMSSKKISDIVNSDPCLKSRLNGLRSEINDFQGFSMRIRDKTREAKPQCYRNPYDISRNQIIDQIHRMRNNFLQPPRLIKYQDEDQMHSLPVSQMGNYQEYLKRMPNPLRELESAPVRQHMFGNPFKIDKGRALGMIDEADIDLVGGNSPVRSPKRPIDSPNKTGSPSLRVKRRPGPLSKELAVQYMSNHKSFRSLSTPPSSPLSTPPNSPLSSATDTSFSSLPSSPTSANQSPSSPSASVIPPNSLTTNNSTNNTNDSNNIHNIQLTEPPEIEVVNNVDDDVEIVKVPDPEVIIVNTVNEGTNETLNRLRNSIDNSKDISSNNTLHNNNHSDSLCNGLSNSSSNSYLNNYRWKLSPEQVELKREVCRSVRKPGKNFKPILSQLSSCNGPFRDYLAKEIIAEATRFKRKTLIEVVQKFISEPNASLRLG